MKKIILFISVFLFSYSLASADMCIQVIQDAKNEETWECKSFSTPCDVPDGWEIVDSCDSEIEDNQIIDKIEDIEKKEKEKSSDIEDFKLKRFSSCEDIETVMWDYIKNYYKNIYSSRYRWWWFWLVEPMIEVDMSFSEGVESDSISATPQAKSVSLASNSIETASDDSSYSKTNVQVDWVDESDIIKTDWDYIYYLRDSYDRELRKNLKHVYIIKADSNWEMELIKRINIPSNFNNIKLYISENRLVIIANWYSNINYSKYNYLINRNQKTYSIVYDTSDKSKPKLLKLYIWDWYLSKSRKIWDYLYILSTNYVNIPYNLLSEDKFEIDASKIIPKKIDISKTSDKSKQNLEISWKKLPYNIKSWNTTNCKEIEYFLPAEDSLEKYSFNPSYTILSVINLKNTSEKVENKVIFWNSSEVYMSLENLYITDRVYSSIQSSCPFGARCIVPHFRSGENTLVHKLSIDKKNIDYISSNMIPGLPLNQYSMDEKDWDFRIISQTRYPDRETSLYVLDKDLKLVSSLGWLWEWEDFKSSRFMWDKLYLVTFKQIDPFYVIDLKDREKPKVLWKLKIPGYSTYLHPYDENHIIGLGYDTFENKWWWTQNWWLKISLYEIDYDRKADIWKNWKEEEKRLIWLGCEKVVVDIDWNTCNVNKEKTAFDQWCTEMETTEFLDIPKCISWDFQQNLGDIYIAEKYSVTMWDRWSSSEALNNPRMFVFNKDKNLLFLPARIQENDSDDTYKTKSIYQWLFLIKIDKDSGIEEKFRTTHIDTDKLEEERLEECSKYIVTKEDTECRKLIDWTTYCPPKTSKYVPTYCYADSDIGEYLSQKIWNYSNYYVKRALYIDDSFYSVSDKKIKSNSLNNYQELWDLYLK